MPILKLRRRAVSGLPRVTKTTIYYDADLTGFGIKVTPTGAQSWVVEYRPGAGGRGVAKRRMVIGSPATLSPEQAREAAGKLLAAVKLGADPAADRSEARKADTVDDILDHYLKHHVMAKRKVRTVEIYTGFARHIRATIGKKAAPSLTVSEVRRFHGQIGKSHPVTANRAVALLSTVYAYAIKTKALPRDTENPATGIEPFDEKPRQRYLTTEELQRLGDAIREAETAGIPWEPDPTKKAKHAAKPENRRTKIDQYAAAAIRLLLFTGCRLREILNLRWVEYDAGRGLLFLPDSKTGQKTVVLSAPALAVLESLPRLGIYVIAGESAGTKDEQPRADLNRPWRAVRKRAGIEDVRIHDLRPA
jgi:integrase